MSRDLTTDLLAAITATSLRLALFYEGEFTGGTLRLWSGVSSIDWNGHTWTGGGNLLSISEIQETTEIRAAGITVIMNGVNSALISAALAQTRQGLPGRVWIGALGREAYLSLPGASGNYASTPDSAAVSVTGDIDIRVKAALDDWTPSSIAALVFKYSSSSGQKSYAFRVTTSGLLNLLWSNDGTTDLSVVSSVAPTVSNGATLWVRVTMDVSTGSGREVKFYTSPDGFNWTQLGTTHTSTATSIFNGTLPVHVGANDVGTGNLLAGEVYAVEIRNGIDGTVVASFDPSTDAGSRVASFTSSATGEVWTINQSGATPAAIVVDDNHVIADPCLAFEGRLDAPDIRDQGDSITVAINYESRLIDLERPRIRRITHEDQQIDYPGDLGREYVAGLQAQSVIW